MRKIYFVLVSGSILLSVILFLFIPSIRPYLTGEDQLVETLTAYGFLFAAFYNLAFFFSTQKGAYRKTFLLFSLLGLFFFLEEVGFGQRLFSIPMPTAGGGQVDGVHDVFRMVYLKLRHLPALYLQSAGLLIMSLGMALVLVYRQKLIDLLYKAFVFKPYYFLGSCGLLLALATLFDLGIVRSDMLRLLEELCEMNAGLALNFGSIEASILLMTQSATILAPSFANYSSRSRLKPVVDQKSKKLSGLEKVK